MKMMMVQEKHGDLQMEFELLSRSWHVIRVASNGKIDENRARPFRGFGSHFQNRG